MSGQWVVLGFDRFDYDYYPVSLHADKGEALRVAVARDAAAPTRQPGGLHDIYSVEPLLVACRLCELSENDVRTLAAVTNQ